MISGLDSGGMPQEREGKWGHSIKTKIKIIKNNLIKWIKKMSFGFKYTH
jgi:hypothetical protein